ncbi:MAG: aminodeoxychorismate lyase [Pseudomonadota bacterium]|nr:aminodeoxychorismate lyase [Pseudomonadota bacterium]
MADTALLYTPANGWQPAAGWPATDRALNYGDGLFETFRFSPAGEIPLWRHHRQRLRHGLVALDFPLQTAALIEEAISALRPQTSAGKLLVSRGSGPRGYLPPADAEVQILFQPFTAPSWAAERLPQGMVCEFSDVQLAVQPLLAGFKHLNRLEQVLARSRFPAHCHEVIMTDMNDWVIEGCMSNLLLLEGEQWLTPDLSRCGVNGVVRRWLQETLDISEAAVERDRLLKADALLLCNTLNGISAVQSVASRKYHLHPSIAELQQQFQEQFA